MTRYADLYSQDMVGKRKAPLTHSFCVLDSSCVSRLVGMALRW